MVLWIIAGLALLIALVALASARRLARRLDSLTQSYWELRYDFTRLRSQVARLDPEQAEAEGASGAPAGTGTPASSSVSFVPLSSMKKKSSG